MSYIDELISILQAFKEGKTIQCRMLGFSEWHEANGKGWNFGDYEYRVKPEPREWTARLGKDAIYFDNYAHDHLPTIKVREVLE